MGDEEQSTRMNKVLMISYIFPPLGGVGGIRTLKFAKYLPGYHWEPTVLAVKPYRTDALDYSLLKEIPDQVEVVRTFSLEPRRLPVTMSGSRRSSRSGGDQRFALPTLGIRSLRTTVANGLASFFAIPDHCIGWFPFALRAGTEIARRKKIDVIYSSFPPATSHIIAYQLSRRLKIPWIADFRDPWSRFDKSHTRLHQWVSQKTKDVSLQESSGVIAATSGVKDELLREYPELDHKIRVITNGYDEDDFGHNYAPSDDQFTIVYTGHSEGFDPSSLFAAIKRLLNERRSQVENWKIQFIGQPSAGVYSSIKQQGLEPMIEIKGYLPYNETLRHQQQASVLLLYGWAPGYLPVKGFEYLRAGRPILCLDGPNTILADLIRRSNTGAVVNPDDEIGIADALMKFYENRTISPDEQFITQFSRMALAGQLGSFLNDVADKRTQ